MKIKTTSLLESFLSVHMHCRHKCLLLTDIKILIKSKAHENRNARTMTNVFSQTINPECLLHSSGVMSFTGLFKISSCDVEDNS